MAAASAALVLVALPPFLVGGLAVQIRADLGLSVSAIGVVVSGAFVVGAATAPFAGRLADRVGARAAIASGLTLSLVAMVGIAVVSRSGWHVAMFLGVAGAAIAITDPGLAILLTHAVPSGRHGLAFGVKEASIPAAMMVAGLAVPVLALTAGWRWAFALGAVPLTTVVALRARIPAREPVVVRPVRAARGAHGDLAPRASARRPPRVVLVLIAVGTAVGLAAASGVGVFLTQSAVDAGVSPGAAGLLLAVASAGGVAVRLVSGVIADRRGGEHLHTIAGMLAVGAVLLLLGAHGSTVWLAISAIGAFAAVWGWTGLLFLSLVRVLPDTPGAAAGIGVIGLTAGNGLGPLLFGIIAERASFAAAWTTAAALSATGGTLLWLAAHRLHASGHQQRS